MTPRNPGATAPRCPTADLVRLRTIEQQARALYRLILDNGRGSDPAIIMDVVDEDLATELADRLDGLGLALGEEIPSQPHAGQVRH